MANWTPDSFVGELFRTMGKYDPPPPISKSTLLWGTEERLHELFGDGVASLQSPQRSFVFRYLSTQLYAEYTRTYYAPLLTISKPS